MISENDLSFLPYCKDRFKVGDIVTFMKLPESIEVQIVEIEESIEDDLVGVTLLGLVLF